MWETRVQSLGRDDLLEKEEETHSSIRAWKIPWTEEPAGYGSQRVGHDWATSLTSQSLKHQLRISPWTFLQGVRPLHPTTRPPFQLSPSSAPEQGQFRTACAPLSPTPAGMELLLLLRKHPGWSTQAPVCPLLPPIRALQTRAVPSAPTVPCPTATENTPRTRFECVRTSH